MREKKRERQERGKERGKEERKRREKKREGENRGKREKKVASSFFPIHFFFFSSPKSFSSFSITTSRL